MAAPELELNDEEAKKFAASLARVSSLYDDRINPKLVAWIDLLCVAGSIYGPRAIAISARFKAEKGPRVVTIDRQSRTTVKGTGGEGPRSPVEMFGDVFYGANIPDAG